MAKRSKQKRREEIEARRKAKQRAQLRTWVGYGSIPVLLIGLIVAVSLFRQVGGVSIAEAAPNIDGDPSAPVMIVEYGDFGCHACRAWHLSGTKEQLQAAYGDEIAFEFRHFPVITRNSPIAAAASQCAAEQDAFWPYHDYLYEVGQEQGLNAGQLRSYAADIGLNSADFNACIDSGKYNTFVDQQLDEARQVGARATPTFMVNGQLIASPTYASLSAAINAALSN